MQNDIGRIWRQQCRNPERLRQKHRKKFAVGLSNREIPVDHPAQKTERLFWSSSWWPVKRRKSPESLFTLALAGNVRCIQLCLDRLLPRRNGRPVDFSLPAVNDVHDVVTAMAAITTGVNNGDLTVEEAGQLAQILVGNAKVLETYDLASRIEALESQTKKRP